MKNIVYNYFETKGSDWGNYRAPAVRYCENCNTFHIGKFESYKGCNIARNLDLYQAAFEQGKVLTDAVIENVTTKMARDSNGKIDQKYAKKKFYEFKKDLETPEFKMLLQAREDVIALLTAENCPVCGAPFDNIPEHHISYLVFEKHGEQIWLDDKVVSTFKIHGRDAERIVDYMRQFNEKHFKAKASEKCRSFQKSVDIMSAPKTTTADFTDKNTLKNYIQNILILENSIFAVTTRLRELYEAEIISRNQALDSHQVFMQQAYADIVAPKEKRYRKLKSADPSAKILLEDIPIELPPKPPVPAKPTMTKPILPVLQKPGLFNKKKILAANELLMTAYEKECAEYSEQQNAYNERQREYQEKLFEYNQIVTQLKQAQKEEHAAAVEKEKTNHAEALQKAQENYNSALENYQNAISCPYEFLTPENAAYSLVQEEVACAEELLKKLYIARNDLYAYGIVFEKYRNLVAISSIYEYLASGRCMSLDGHEGAYNIYESEIRMDRVVSRLDLVIDSLEKIQQNQYMIYSAIQNVNSQLATLNSKMSAAVASLERIETSATDMKAYMKTIADNTAVIAYNTERTAFYAKKNAELTNALGYMIALS